MTTTEWLTPDQVSERLGISKDTLASWRYKTNKSGRQYGPPFKNFGPRSPRYPASVLNENAPDCWNSREHNNQKRK